MTTLSGTDAGMLPPDEPDACGGALVLDLAICLILAVTVVGLLMLAL